MNKLLYIIIIPVVLLAIGTLIYVVTRDLDRDKRAEEYALKNNCEYLGAPKHLGFVKFFECNKEIRLVKIK